MIAHRRHPHRLVRSASGFAVALLMLFGVRNEVSAEWSPWTPEILDGAAEARPYLPDYSYAGYAFGEKAPPHHPVTMHVKDFGASANDHKDDTSAILRAVEEAHAHEGPVVLGFDAGRYILREVIWIERSDFALRGQGCGPDGTVLDVPVPLAEMDLSRDATAMKNLQKYLDSSGREGFSPFSWSRGVIWARMKDAPESQTLTQVRSGTRGKHALVVKDSRGLRPGQMYRLLRHDPEVNDSLFEHVYDHEGIKVGSWLAERPVYETVVVTKVDGNRVEVKAPLLHDVQPEWKGELVTFPVLRNVGIDKLRIEFPNRKRYGGHHKEDGYNGIYMNRVRDGWIRDVAVMNGDSGIILGATYCTTTRDIEIRESIGAHYGIHVGWGQHNLVRNFHVDTRAIHTLSFNTGCRASVFTSGVDHHSRLDQHCGMNLQNLFDNIEVRHAQPGFSLFLHGGGQEFFPLHGAFNTFWNIRLNFDTPEKLAPPVTIQGSRLPGPSVRIIGMTANVPVALEGYHPNPYIEGTNRDDLGVPSLYLEQVKNRLGISAIYP